MQLSKDQYVKFIWWGRGLEPESLVLKQYQRMIVKIYEIHDYSAYIWLLNQEGEYSSYTLVHSSFLEPAFSNSQPTQEEVAMLTMLGYQLPRELLND